MIHNDVKDRSVSIETSPKPGWWQDGVLLLLLLAIALMPRMWQMGEMVRNGHLWIFSDDTPYHLRRVLMTLETWPWVPAIDPFVNFPHKATISWPPGLTWLTATLARLLGAQSAGEIEWLTAYIPPLIGALGVWLLYLTCRPVLGRRAAFLAAALLAMIPAHVQYTGFARFDHHIFEPLLSWLCLFFVLRSAHENRLLYRVCWVTTGALTVTAALLVWPGVLLHLGMLTAALLFAILILEMGKAASSDASFSPAAQKLARAGAWVFGASLLTSYPALFVSPWTSEPVFFAFSPLHLACLAVAGSTLAVLGYTPFFLQRLNFLYRLLLAICLPVACFLALPVLRHALFEGIRYTIGSDFAVLAEEFSGIGTSPMSFLLNAGGPVAFCTIAAFGLLLWIHRTSSSRWQQAFASLTPFQHSFILVMTGAAFTFFLPALLALRWLAVWAPFGAFVAVSLWITCCRPMLQTSPPDQKRRWAIWLSVLLLGLFAPSLFYNLELLPLARADKAAQVFFRRMRVLTPSPSPQLYSAKHQPTYGILASWDLGHIITYLSQRPTLANNFFGIPYHDRANRLALRLLLGQDCDQVAETMERHKLKYVLLKPESTTSIYKLAQASGLDPKAFVERGQVRPAALRSLLLRLGLRDGQFASFQERHGQVVLLPACGRFRLIAETHLYPSAPTSPGHLKLYEQVKGAILQIKAPPGTRVSVSIPLVTHQGRVIVWDARAIAPSSGQLTQRVPYPTDGPCWTLEKPCPLRVTRRWYEINIGKQKTIKLPVSSAAIENGARLFVH